MGRPRLLVRRGIQAARDPKWHCGRQGCVRCEHCPLLTCQGSGFKCAVSIRKTSGQRWQMEHRSSFIFLDTPLILQEELIVFVF